MLHRVIARAAKRAVLCAGLALLSAGLPLDAQQSMASIEGDVLDPSSRLIPSAEVTAIHVDTHRTYKTTTGESGAYYLKFLPPGAYDVAFTASGFKRYLIPGVKLEVDQRARLDAHLEVGDVQQTVSVVGESSLLQASSGSIGTVVVEQQIRDLPLNGRKFLDLTLLTPGAAPTPGGSRQQTLRGTLNSAVNMNGSRESSNVFLMDGTFNHDVNYNTLVISPNVDSIQEFRVETNNYSAEFGQQAGAQINLITKSGGNAFHGTVHEYLRNSKLDAKNLFDRPRPAKIPAFRQNQFGGTIGGPVRQDRTFFFASYEGFRQVQAQTAIAIVPDARVRSGDFGGFVNSAGQMVTIHDPATTAPNPAFDSAQPASPSNPQYLRTPFANNVIPAARISPIAAGIMNYVDLPNLAQLPLNYGQFLNNFPQQQHTDQGSGRIDHSFSDKDRVFLRYSRSDESLFQPSLLTSQGTRREPTAHVATLSYTRTLTPTLVNDVRLGFNRYVLNIVNKYAFQENIAEKLGIQGVGGLPPSTWDIPIVDLTSTGLSIIGPVALPDVQRDNTFHFTETLSMTRGRNDLRFGFQLARLQLNEAAQISTIPQYSYRGTPYTANVANPTGMGAGSNLADFLLGHSQQNNISVGDPQVYLRRTYLAPWINHTWRATRNLTITAGFRWEFDPPLVEKHDHLSGVAVGGLNGPGPLVVITANQDVPGYGKVPRGLFETQWHNFAPRLGIAYRLGSSGKTVIRTGYGIFYDAEIGNTTVDQVRNPPFRRSVAAVAPDAVFPLLTIAQPLSPQATFGNSYIGSGQNENGRMQYPLGMVQQWNLALQHEVTPGIALEAAYVGSTGRHLSFAEKFNLSVAGPGPLDPRRPLYPFNTAFQFVLPRVNSYYHSLQFKVETRAWKGLTALFSYTYAKSIDTGQQSRGASGGTQVFSINNLNLDLENRGRSNFDLKYRSVISVNYQIPYHPRSKPLDLALGQWQWNSIVAMRTGFPMTIYSGVDTSNSGQASTTHASIVPGQSLRPAQPTVTTWLNKVAFTPAPDCRQAAVFAALPSPIPCYGDAGRNIVDAPGQFNLDASLFKNFPIRENIRLQFRAEAFNLTNTPPLGFPSTLLSDPSFGRILSAGPSRQLQFALRLMF